jgi:prepilin-type N-terminal cleavage/methylation domain-containing protein
MKNKKAFTLIELLIVIAIIGILAGVVTVNTSNSNKKAKVASALMTMNSVARIANQCLSDGGSLVIPVAGTNPGSAICNTGAETLPSLASTTFTYCGSGCGGWTSNSASGTYAISAYTNALGPRKAIVCGMGVNASNWFWANSPVIPEFNFSNTVGCALHEG